MKRTKISPAALVNPLHIAPGDTVKDLRPLTYGQIYVVARPSQHPQFKHWLVMSNGVLIHPQRLALVKRANGHLI